jgi:hypothetical protein
MYLPLYLTKHCVQKRLIDRWFNVQWQMLHDNSRREQHTQYEREDEYLN